MVTGSFIPQIVTEHLVYEHSMLVLPELRKRRPSPADRNIRESTSSSQNRKRAIHTLRPKAQMKRQDAGWDPRQVAPDESTQCKCPEARQCHWTLGT